MSPWGLVPSLTRWVAPQPQLRVGSECSERLQVPHDWSALPRLDAEVGRAPGVGRVEIRCERDPSARL